ncbi:sensor histidine kinase [Variovorax sp. LT1R16]|uniref:sensor histidine kinase n=1 Tax=Variovorax sp. LT1R16 TaxID=3443728 RepID=UPI003F48AA52
MSTAASHPPTRWQRWTRPTLVRRLLLGQVATLALLWSVLVGLFLVEAFNQDMYGATDAYDAVFSVAENLADRPELQHASLQAIDVALREAYGDKNEPAMAPSILVWQAGRLVYKSDSVPEAIRNTELGTIERLFVDGRYWRASTQQSPRSDTRVALVTPSDRQQLIVTFNSRGYYLLPLIISIPLLLLPAWLSIRLALRPWREVSAEIAARGPKHLTPLAFAPPHAELRPLLDSVNALMQRLSDSATRERNFIADAAHELRTPIAAIRINVEALQAQHRLNEHQSELLDGVLRSIDRATRLVGQLLRLMRSSADSDAGPSETLALDELLQDRLAALSGLAQVRGVELELEVTSPGLCVLGAREGLTSMVDNLVENATRYSPPATVVTVRLVREGNEAVLTVTDQGLGIDPALQERVFDRFFRAPDQTQTGSGLGLAIVKSVVDKHGGRIALAPNATVGRGLQVTVRLPLAQQ